MKRHEKPYRCTFDKCFKKFGSKNDWKRHENSQHCVKEVWRCDEIRTDDSSETCGNNSLHRELFVSHLEKVHKLQDDAIEKKLSSCRVGRNCEANFWCGFCQVIVSIKGKGLEAWTERFDHIDDHIAGRRGLAKTTSDDWRGLDPNESGPQVDDGSGSESDNCDSRTSRTSTTRKAPSHHHRRTEDQHKHLGGRKRKLDEEEDFGRTKRTRPDQASTGVVTCVSMPLQTPRDTQR